MPRDWTCRYCSWQNVIGVPRCDDCDAPAPKPDSPSPTSLDLTQLTPNVPAGEAPPPSPPARSEREAESPPTSGQQPPPSSEQEAAYVLDPRYSRSDFPWSARMTEENERVFGGSSLRIEQQQAINAALDGKDVLVVLPTGAGKSRCYQLPALLDRGLTVLVVPLLSLMTDQHHALNAAGIPAQFMNSNQNKDETSQVGRPDPAYYPRPAAPPPPSSARSPLTAACRSCARSTTRGAAPRCCSSRRSGCTQAWRCRTRSTACTPTGRSRASSSMRRTA